MGWRERDWARFTDAERKALYGGGGAVDPPYYCPPTPSGGRRRSALAPGAGIAIAVSLGVLLLGQFPRQHPLLPALRIGSPSVLVPTHHTFPLNLFQTATYGSTLTINGTDPNATSGTIVAAGQWNGGPWLTVGSSVLASDHSWSVPISMNQHGTLNIRISLPSGDSLVGAVTVQP